MDAQHIQLPLSNMQLQLLQLYSNNVSDDDLSQIKDLLAQYFAQKATRLVDKIWDEKGLDAEMILNQHLRTPYKKK
jgi:hypothetical protein